MAFQSFLWNFTKRSLTAENYVNLSDVLIHGRNARDYALYIHGDSMISLRSSYTVRVMSSPINYKEKNVKRIAALPGDWIHLPSLDTLRVPEGHCWVVGDDASCSLDSRSLGPIPVGLISGRITHVVWPPQRIGRISSEIHMLPKVQVGVSDHAG